MSSINKNLKIYRSSAGSGKTYTLALNYISLSLLSVGNFKENYYRKILAITFTNKAAAEMKERILKYFGILAKQDNEDGILEELIKLTNLSEDEIYRRSKKIREHILHHYADLSISTIDKFTYNIVRTFASDLGLSHNFELEMDNNKIIKSVVSLLLSRMNEGGGDLSHALVHFAIQKADDGKSTNIETDLEEFSQHLFKEDSLQYIESNVLSVSDCMKVKDTLINKKQILIQKIKQFSFDVESYFAKVGFTDEHFTGKTFYNHFINRIRLEDDEKWVPVPGLQKNMNNDVWYAQSKKQHIKDLVDLHKADLEKIYSDYMILFSEYISMKSALKNIYSIAVLNELISELKQYKKDQNIEQISVFNKMIHKIITSQPSSFIYERLGERYNHFLIDEFQDTSVLQWQNMLPLITDSLDFGKNLIVGDGKQSIYRWRGGEVEQFVKIPEIFKGENLPPLLKTEWENKLVYHHDVDNLKSNFRSKKEIIDFNNDFFGKIKGLLSPDLQKIYDGYKQDVTDAKSGGYVHLELVEDTEDGFKEEVISKMIQEINKRVDDKKFKYKDVTVLCNSRKRVSMVAEKFTENKIPVISNEGLLLSSSEKVNVIIASLKFLQDSKNEIAKTSIVKYVERNILSNNDLHQLNLKVKTEKSFITLLKDANITLYSNKLIQLPLYELMENIINAFGIQEDLYIQFFLDSILKFSEKKGGSISAFLEWWEDKKEKESIVVSDETNAVTIMTIHKSKGLAFNVVMIPFNWEDQKNSSEIWVDIPQKMGVNLKSALISGSSKLENSDFKNEYELETNLTLLDNINKLYVASTRAKHRLYIYAKKYPKNLSGNFPKSGKLNSFLFAFGKNYPYIKGDKNEKITEKDKGDKEHFNVPFDKKSDWRNIISLKYSSDDVWDAEQYNKKRDWGLLLHFALSKIIYTRDKEIVLKNLLSEGKCNGHQFEELNTEITKLFEIDEIAEFFTDKWNVKTEKEILMQDGKTYIPDRLIFNDDKTIVVDYKTGVRENHHINQITNYANALSEIGYKNIEKVLIYTSEKDKVFRL
ncbi:MAG: UvrD-helicase domain-containing protein [Flavobacteriales bacterium]|nr:UvrD-helicase domain-containing protein [Flavobacteriales bacterium]MBT6013944.1 UvrD-helicase domain-containing protein [Flavobacteriales bacterium]MBT7480941.1 UvrD-helicase domain-containing protein [Flavobacteriales bacterium]